VGIKILNELAMAVKELDKPLIIEGHTDSTPINTEKYPSNWELSTARATNIVKYFIKHCGYTPNRLSAVGYGEFAPIVANDNVKNKAKNRRVDIILLDNNNYTEK
jgi:chemotaxis protein MotB